MKIVVAGDFFPGLRLAPAMAAEPREILADLLPLMEDADYSIVNLEAPITTCSTPIHKTGPALKTSTQAGVFLKKAGFDLVTLANNHILDYRENGIRDTIEALDKLGLPHVGAGLNVEAASQPVYIERGAIRVAILNFAENEWSTTNGNSAGACPIHPVENHRLIQEAKRNADFVTVIVHGGHEMYRYPSPRMKKLYRFYIDAGASVVVNHHPHCTSGYEIYKGYPIFYSLGNFLFDHERWRGSDWNKGMVVALSFSKAAGISFELIHFNQCDQEAKLNVCSAAEQQRRDAEILQINGVIADDVQLKASFDTWVHNNRKMYRAFIEPHGNRYLQALQNRGWLPSLWKLRKKRYLLNLVRCEAHRDILQAILEDDVSDS